MPEICRFYGIVIKMFFKPKEHEPSYLHALYGEHIGIFDLKTMKMTEGDLPTRAQQLVQEWMSAHQDTVTLLCEAQHNSVALPCAEYIMAGIAEALTKGGANDGI